MIDIQTIGDRPPKHASGSSSSSEAVAADLQSQSSFFSVLPLEIRQKIYQQLWADGGSTQHVYQSNACTGAPLPHSACVSDVDAEDMREMEFLRVLEALPTREIPDIDDRAPRAQALTHYNEINSWRRRNTSVWCNHWMCEENSPIMRTIEDHTYTRDNAVNGNDDRDKLRTSIRELSPFLATLLVCKRVYQEAIESMYNDTNFSIIGDVAFSRFLETTSARSLGWIKTVHLIWVAPVESYMDPQEPLARAAQMQWLDLWTKAKEKLHRLANLRVWMYPKFSRFPLPHEEWFQPLYLFQSIPTYEICLSWFESPSGGIPGSLKFSHAPFKFEQKQPLEERHPHAHWRRMIDVFPRHPRLNVRPIRGEEQ